MYCSAPQELIRLIIIALWIMLEEAQETMPPPPPPTRKCHIQEQHQPLLNNFKTPLKV